MNRIHPRSFGFAFAVFLATWHTAWALLVWTGTAQRLLDFVFRLHMIAPPYQVTAFSPITAAALISLTAVIGYISGWFIGVVWNLFALRPAVGSPLEHHGPTHAH